MTTGLYFVGIIFAWLGGLFMGLGIKMIREFSKEKEDKNKKG